MSRNTLRAVDAFEAPEAAPPRVAASVDPLVVTRAVAGALLAISRPTVVKLVQEGKLREVAIGRRRLVTRASIRALLGEASS